MAERGKDAVGEDMGEERRGRDGGTEGRRDRALPREDLKYKAPCCSYCCRFRWAVVSTLMTTEDSWPKTT